jgi:hypothetical protein
MPRCIRLAPYLTDDELHGRYRRSADPVERSLWHFLWLLASGMTATAVAAVTGYSAYWIGHIAHRYNRDGPDGVRDRRHARSAGRPDLAASHGKSYTLGPSVARMPVERERRRECVAVRLEILRGDQVSGCLPAQHQPVGLQRLPRERVALKPSPCHRRRHFGTVPSLTRQASACTCRAFPHEAYHASGWGGSARCRGACRGNVRNL